METSKEWMDGWMDRQIKDWVDGWIFSRPHSKNFIHVFLFYLCRNLRKEGMLYRQGPWTSEVEGEKKSLPSENTSRKWWSKIQICICLTPSPELLTMMETTLLPLSSHFESLYQPPRASLVPTAKESACNAGESGLISQGRESLMGFFRFAAGTWGIFSSYSGDVHSKL